MHLSTYYNAAVGVVILQHLCTSLAETSTDLPTAAPVAARPWGSDPYGGHDGSGDALTLSPLGPTASDLPLAASIYSACPDDCGRAALQAVVAVTQRCRFVRVRES